MVVTWTDKLKAERQEGRKEGRQEGCQEMQELVVRLFTDRFGQPPKRLRERIASITSFKDLRLLAERVFRVDSPEELGLG